MFMRHYENLKKLIKHYREQNKKRKQTYKLSISMFVKNILALFNSNT